MAVAAGGGEVITMKTHCVVSRPLTSHSSNTGIDRSEFSPASLGFTRAMQCWPLVITSALVRQPDSGMRVWGIPGIEMLNIRQA